MRRVAMEYSPKLRHPVRLARRRRHDRAGAAVRRRGRVVGRSHPAVRGGLGRGGDRHAPRRRPDKLLPRQGPRVRRDRAAHARRRADDRIRHPAADGRLVSRRRARQRFGSERLGRGKRRQSALSADGGRASRDSAPTSSCCSISGASSIDPARSMRTSRGWAIPAGTVPERYARGVRGRRGRARRRDRARAARRRATAGAPRLAGRSRGVVGAARAPATATTSCTAPATASAKSVHGNGVNMDDYETHDDRRLLAGTGFTIEPGVYFDDFGVRSEINMIVGSATRRVTGPVQTEILALALGGSRCPLARPRCFTRC